MNLLESFSISKSMGKKNQANHSTLALITECEKEIQIEKILFQQCAFFSLYLDVYFSLFNFTVFYFIII